jgi:tryptophan-rich sensory protein
MFGTVQMRCTLELYVRFLLSLIVTFSLFFTLSPSFFTLPISPHSLLSSHFDPLTSPFFAHPTSLLENFIKIIYILITTTLCLVLYKGAVHKNCMWGFCSPFSSLSLFFFHHPLSLYTPPFLHILSFINNIWHIDIS